MNNQDRAYQEWLVLRERVRSQTTVNIHESPQEKEKRIKKLLSNFSKFCKYYFPHYMYNEDLKEFTEFGWFHLEAAEAIINDINVFAILEWAREHAKSVIADIFIPMHLKALGQFTGMIIGSSTETKAKGLLGDIQAELMDNQRYIADFGEQACYGDWNGGHFATKDGCGFWAFGRGQSPRGARKGANRPNYAVIDDIDDKEIVRNQARVKEATEWVLEDLFGCLAIGGGRLVVAGNRIHKHSILAHLVGDTEPDKAKRKGITHIKVYAIEDEHHNKCDAKHPKARPAWKERYTMEQLVTKMEKMGYRSAQKEYFHEHIEEGLIFQNKWIYWAKAKDIKDYHAISVYCDPSFKDGKGNDFKAIIATARFAAKFDILKAFVRQCSTTAMVQGFYDMFELFGKSAKYWMEANFLQDILLQEFDREAAIRGQTLPIRPDKEKKVDKFTRIENLTPFFERGLVNFNEAEKQNPDMLILIDQLLGFGNPSIHDDAPDALEGGISKLQKAYKKSDTTYAVGNYSHHKRKF